MASIGCLDMTHIDRLPNPQSGRKCEQENHLEVATTGQHTMRME
jgi:hypothetical protein